MDSSLAPPARPAALAASLRVALLAAALTLLGLALRLYGIDSNGLRLDEIWSVWMVQRDAPAIVSAILFQKVDASPPAYYLLLHGAMQLGEGLLAVRALSALAGALTVWLTFALARLLFDLRVALLAGLLMAVAPLHVEYSQVARAYVLASLWTLLALYCFARLVLAGGRPRPAHWAGFTAATLAALYTHYLTGLVVLAEGALVLWLLARPRGARPPLSPWLLTAGLLAVGVLPLLYPALRRVGSASGQGWLERPGPAAMVKSAILFGTGDPSYGPTGLTIPRILSALVILAIAALALWLVVRRWRAGGAELRRLALLACIAFVPLALAFAVSQLRPIYKEKYLLFIMPALFILAAWALARGPALVAVPLKAALLGLTLAALLVYYTAPAGEQWREAMSYLRSAYRPGDLIVISPGYYSHPLMYYFDDEFPEETIALLRAPTTLFEGGAYRALSAGEPPSPPASARRVWVISGSSPASPATARWLDAHGELLSSRAFLGVRVDALRVNGAGGP